MPPVKIANIRLDPLRMDLYNSNSDFAGHDHSMGWYSEGPFENADNLGPAIKRAIDTKESNFTFCPCFGECYQASDAHERISTGSRLGPR
jgi:hypothetical protein